MLQAAAVWLNDAPSLVPSHDALGLANPGPARSVGHSDPPRACHLVDRWDRWCGHERRVELRSAFGFDLAPAINAGPSR
jgi:hypothetical protein